MKKNKLIFLLLNMILSAVLSICLVYTDLQIDINKNPPYALSDHAISISIFQNSQEIITEENKDRVIKALFEILNREKIKMISNNIDNMGLGVYDPNGNYFEENSNNSVIVRAGSYTEKVYIEDKQFMSLGDQIFTISGIYDEKYPLYTTNKEYVYSFFDEPYLMGDFYFDQNQSGRLKAVLTNEIIPLLEDNHYYVTLEKDYGESSGRSDVFRAMATNSLYVFSMLMLLFMYINLFVYYFAISERMKKMYHIHFMVGGTERKIVRYFSNAYFSSILTGSVIGALTCRVIFEGTLYAIDGLHMIFVILFNMTISMLLFKAAVWLSNRKLNKGGENI